MPQLDISTFTPQLFWLAVWFVVLYLLMAKLGLPRIAAALEARRRRREDDLARAAQMKADAEAANAAFQQTMSQARAQAQAVIKAAADRLAAEAAARQRELAARLATQIADAEQRIADARQQALSEVRGIAIDVGRAIVEKLTGAAPEAAKLAAAVDQSLPRQAPGHLH
jgi:F-type H+-transporting ATPase subunit b